MNEKNKREKRKRIFDVKKWYVQYGGKTPLI